MRPFTFNTTPTLVFELGAARRFGAITRKLLGGSVLFVTDPGLRALGLCDTAVASLQAEGCAVAIFDGVEADPSRATLMNAVEAGGAAGAGRGGGLGGGPPVQDAQHWGLPPRTGDAGAAGVVGFGGGSSLDVAKLAALLLGSGEDLDEAWGVAQVKGPRLPLALVPTTAGTGSEVTPVSIITVGDDEKRGVSSSVILPDVAVLDAELTLGLPPAITAATGVDAMVHAIEAYTSRSANNNPLSKMLAKEALRLLGANIEMAVANGRNADARAAMLLGSMLAGQAFANSPVAAVHALAYPIGGTFHVPHGLSNALVLPHVLRFNAPDAALLYAEIAPEAFPRLAKEQGAQACCAAFVEELAALSSRIGLQPRLRDVGIGKEYLEKMAADAMKQQRLLVNNPRSVSEADALSIYQAAW